MAYKIGAVEVGVNPVSAAQVAPPGTLSPADAAAKEALKEQQRQAAANGGVSGKVVLLGVALAALGAYAMFGKKLGKKKASGGHVIAR